MLVLGQRELEIGNVPAWLWMWLLAGSIFAICKAITWLDTHGWRASRFRSAAYLFAWPGMDARGFLFESQPVARPSISEWIFAWLKFGLGMIALYVAAHSLHEQPWLRAWLGMLGIIFTLHFGSFHLLSCCCRRMGISAVALMHWPIAARSVSEFWSRRWNLAFRDLTYRYLFRPLTSRVGGAAALWIGFLASGLIHDVVISVPAGGGYGGPTIFFLLQAAALTAERSQFGKRLGLGRGMTGWIFTALILVLPASLLFHLPFQQQIVLPFLNAIGELL